MVVKKTLLTISLLCLILLGIANNTDSFRTGQNLTGLKDSIDFYLVESELLIDSNPEKSSKNAKKAHLLSAKLNYPERHAYASRLLGEAKLNIQEYYEAEKHLNEALLFYSGTRKKKLIADINYLLGLSRYSLGKFSEALLNFSEASHTYEKLNDPLKYASCMQNIGLVYYNLEQYESAEKNFSIALKIYTENQENKNIAELHQNLGIISFKQGKDSLAINHYLSAISFFKQDHDLTGIGIAHSNVGLVHLDNKNFSKAYKQFEKAYTYFSKTNFEIGQMWALNNMGASQASLQNLHQAEDYFLLSLQIAEKLENKEGILTNYQDLATYYEHSNKLRKAMGYQKRLKYFGDSVFNLQTQERISELETLYLLESKEKERAQTEVQAKRRTTQIYAIASIAFVVLLALIIIVSAFMQKKKAEKRLARHKANLEKLIEQRTNELKKQISERKVAEESDKLKSAFLANMSHELRTPMNAIIAFSNFLREPDLSDENKTEYLDHISSAGDSLLNLIDDIIDIAKIESQQLKLFIQPTNINRLLSETYKLFSELRIKNNKNHIRFNLNIDNDYNYIINTDSNRLKQVLSNLLENAFKYTEKGKIELGFETTSNSVTFYVSDTGHGIPEDKHEIIFDRFSQLKLGNDRRTTNGTGLGLAICKNLVKLLGGKIWVDSEIGKGSKFMIRVPVDSLKKQVNIKTPTRKTGTNNNQRKNYNWNNITILVAEDEDLNYKVLDTCLTRTNAHIIRARDGASAVEICKNQKVDLVLMDIQMPGMDGYEATQEIKRLNNRTPVIAQTSFAMTGEKERCLQAGCDDFVTKPLNIDSLLEKIKSHIMAIP